MSNLPKYREPRKRDYNAKKPGGHPITHGECLKVLAKFPNGATSCDISQKTKYTRNHCGIILTALWKRGVVRRVREMSGNVRFYRYFIKEKA